MELIRRKEELVPKTRKEIRQQLLESGKQYTDQLDQVNEKYRQKYDQIKKKMDELSVTKRE